jgi:chromosomal replication initiation ATPase DnaA
MITIERLKEIVCKICNNNPGTFLQEGRKWIVVTPDKIELRNSKREIVEARQFCHYFSHQYMALSLYEIGQNFGRKDHATVLHSIRTIKNLLESDKRIQKIHGEINEKIKKEIIEESKLSINELFDVKIKEAEIKGINQFIFVYMDLHYYTKLVDQCWINPVIIDKL